MSATNPVDSLSLIKHVPDGDEESMRELVDRGHITIRSSHEFALRPDQRKSGRRFSLSEVEAITGISRRTLFNRLKNPEFPQGEQIGRTRKRMWTLEEVHRIQAIENCSRGRDPDTDKPVVLALSVFKGGVGKTTMSVNLSQYLAMQGYRVLLIDLDAQGSATKLFGILGDEELGGEETALGLFTGDANSLEPSIQRTYWDGLDLVPANMQLYAAEFVIARRIMDTKEAMARYALEGTGKPDDTTAFYAYLKEGIDRVADRYDVVILDTPPALGFITTNALFAADALVVPVHPAPLDFASTVQFFDLLSEVLSSVNGEQQRLGLPPKRWDFVGLLATRYKERDAHQAAILDAVKKTFSDNVMRNHVVETKVLEGLGPSMKTAYEIETYDGDRRTFERAMDCLNKVNFEIEQLIRSLWPSHHEALKKELLGDSK